MANYRDLIVWQKSMMLTEEIYRIVKFLPKEEMYALSDQMRRAVVSIPSNIAEGRGRDSKNEFYRFLAIAQGSRAELETQLEICKRLNYVSESEIEHAMLLCVEVDKMVHALMQKLRT